MPMLVINCCCFFLQILTVYTGYETFVSGIQTSSSPNGYYVILGDRVTSASTVVEHPRILVLARSIDEYYKIHYRSTTDPVTLAKVVEGITRSNPNLVLFHPTLAVIITWILDEEPVSWYGFVNKG